MILFIECCKTKTKEMKYRQTNQNSKWMHVADAKRGKTNTSESQLVLFLLLIGWKKWRELFKPIV